MGHIDVQASGSSSSPVWGLVRFDFCSRRARRSFLKSDACHQREESGSAGADLTRAVLSHASLRHVNLQNVTLKGARLNNVILTVQRAPIYSVLVSRLYSSWERIFKFFPSGGGLVRATLLADPSGANDDFTGAFLQGANLKDLVLPNGTSLENAFVDLAGPNTTPSA